MYDELPDRSPLPAFLTDWVDQHGTPSDPGGRCGPVRAAVYARRSIADPAFVSVSRQVSAAIDHCRKIGASLDHERHVFIDRNRSGRTMAGRVSLAALLAAARSRLYDVLVVQGMDRLTRSVADAAAIHAELESLNIEIHVAGKGPVGAHEVVLGAFQHQKELDDIAARLLNGRRRALESGAVVGTRPKYGYDRLPGKRGYEINPIQASIIRRCFRWIDEGLGRSTLAKMLNDEQVPAPRGGRWRTSNFSYQKGRGLIADPLFMGVWVWGRQSPEPILVDVPHLAIVDKDVFARVLARLRDTAARHPKIRCNASLLSGVVKCACGASMVSDMRGPVRQSVYSCSRDTIVSSCASRVRISMVEAERRYLRVIRDEILEPSHLAYWETIRLEALELMRQRISQERAALKLRIAEIETELDGLDEVDDDLVLSSILGPLEAEYHELWRRREQMEVPSILRVSPIEARDLRETISQMLPKVPYQVTEPREVAAVARMQKLVPLMTVSRDEGGIVLRYLLGVFDSGKEKFVPGPDSPRWLEGRCPPVRRGALSRPELVLQHHRDAEDGRFAFSDREWAAVAHLFERSKKRRGGPRLYAETLVFLARTGLKPKMLPERYGRTELDPRPIRSSGVWLRLLEILDAEGSELTRGIDRERFAPIRRP